MIETVSVRPAFRYISSFMAAWCFYKLFIKPFLSPLRKIPGCPYRPIIGNLLEVIRAGANNNGVRWMQQYKSRVIRFYYFGGEGSVLVADPSVVKHILITNSKNYHRANTSGILNAIAPGFLAFLNGEEHHSLRRLVNPMFTTNAIKGYVPSFDENGRKLVKIWFGILKDGESNGLVNAQDYMTRLTLDTICHCGFDYDMNSLENDQSVEVKAFKHILGGLEIGILKLLYLNWLPTKKNLQIRADMNTYKSTITQVILSKQEKMHSGKASTDILSRLLQATDENGCYMSKDNLYAQVGGFLVAGYETTSMTLTWTLLELAQHPEVQDAARQEVMSLIPDENESLDFDKVENLSYLTAVIKESLRCNTPISTVFRRSLNGDHLQNYYIPAGTLVGINFGALHRLPELWPEPATFKPERFLQDYDKYKFLPFSTGPYMCIGSVFSMIETKVTLALILRNFRFTLPVGYKWKPVRGLATQPKPPLQLVVTPL